VRANVGVQAPLALEIGRDPESCTSIGCLSTGPPRLVGRSWRVYRGWMNKRSKPASKQDRSKSKGSSTAKKVTAEDLRSVSGGIGGLPVDGGGHVAGAGKVIKAPR